MLLKIILLFFPILAFSQSQFRFEHFTIKNGLPQNTVHCTFKDSEGYYWFGTQDGLCRYDGYSVKTFRHNREDISSISDNFILALQEDKFNNLWIGTRNGLNKFDKNLEKFTRIFANENEKKKSHNSVWFVAADSNGNILFSNFSGQLIKVNPENNICEIVYESGIHSRNISNNIYCREEDSTLILYSSEKSSELNRVKSPGENLSLKSLCETKEGEIIAATEKGLFLFKKDALPVPVFREIKNAIPNVVFCDSKKNLWIGTSAGLYIAKGSRKSPLIFLQHQSENAESLSGNSVQSIYEDPDGMLWIGTAEGGVNIYDPEKDVFRIFHHNTSVPLPANSVFGIFQNKNELWVGTNSGLAYFILKNENISGLYSDENKVLKEEIFTGSGKTADSICSNFITTIAGDKIGNIWFGSQVNGISVYDVTTKKWEHLNEKNTGQKINTVFHILCASDGKVWISTMNGLYVCVSKKISKISEGYVFSAYEDTDKTIWSGTTSGMYHHRSNGELIADFQSEPDNPKSLSYNMPTSLFRDSKGNFWVTTLGGGLNLFDENTRTFSAFTTKNGLPNDVIYCILEDKSGKLWLSTNRGISCYNVEKNMFTNFSEKDGIVSKEFAQNSAFITANGEVLFGSPEGLSVFSPEKINFSKSDFPVIITSLKINYVERNYHTGNEIELFSGDKTISFEFSAPDFRNQHRIFYSFKLEGFDNDWHNVSSNSRIASYTNLPFGEYIFKIRVKNGNSDWQKKQLSIKTRIIPPFWLKGWFITLEIIAAVIIFILTIKYYSQRKLRKQLHEIELKHKIHIERERISRDLHDNVGSNLTYITTALDNISYKIERDEKELSQKKISTLSDFTRATMQQLRETIWAINKESVMISQFKDKVNTHLSNMLSNENNINFTVHSEGDDQINFKPSVAIHLFRIVQEAVNNCIKHSEAKTISVKISSSREKQVIIKISDDGKGFDTSQIVNGHYGVENMRSRIVEIGGTFKLNSRIGKGTDLLIEIPTKFICFN